MTRYVERRRRDADEERNILCRALCGTRGGAENILHFG
jgi:hypothetical protein